MKTFLFNKKIIDQVIYEIDRAESYIKIAVFQIHNKKIFDALNERLKNKVKVEIITLPYDSINKDVMEEVVKRFEVLINNGAVVYFCRWNVGDPERTTTAVGRWYSFHGKFMVTEKSALGVSANFTGSIELDTAIIFKGEMDKIEEFNQKFDQLFRIFILDDGNYLREMIKENVSENSEEIFSLPRVIKSNEHKDFWIKHYPMSLCPPVGNIEDKLYITPFDSRARDLYKSVMSEAQEFIFLSSESFTDKDFCDFIIRSHLNGKEIKVLTGASSMDFTDRLNEMFKKMLANKIAVRTTLEPLHAKLMITDKHIVISSINLNKMNLGFKRTKSFWRANTETALVINDEKIKDSAKAQYLAVFGGAIDIQDKLAEKNEKIVGSLLSSTFALKSRKEVKILFARLLILQEIETKSTAYKIAKITSEIVKITNKRIVDKDDFLKSVILYYLSERKHSLSDLKDKLLLLDSQIETETYLKWLMDYDFIEKIEDYYKLRVERLFF